MNIRNYIVPITMTLGLISRTECTMYIMNVFLFLRKITVHPTFKNVYRACTDCIECTTYIKILSNAIKTREVMSKCELTRRRVSWEGLGGGGGLLA